ncbi:hypothetical protein HaLaN_03371 [Haematococcus lacustris]|uniref:Uncharacterized protein n=1 Tax=Haematococcus lacustris TaxID=44745 RepID=A0A699YEA2_HAELA|nr:hypothetical protein HaLaN_03371 [Haematococcus lacustris]
MAVDLGQVAAAAGSPEPRAPSLEAQLLASLPAETSQLLLGAGALLLAVDAMGAGTVAAGAAVGATYLARSILPNILRWRWGQAGRTTPKVEREAPVSPALPPPATDSDAASRPP